MHQGDDRAAEALMRADAFPGWQAEIARLTRQHGQWSSYERSDATPSAPGQRPIALTRWTWKDGFVRCLRVQERPSDKIVLLDGTFRPCDERSAPDVLRPGPPPLPQERETDSQRKSDGVTFFNKSLDD